MPQSHVVFGSGQVGSTLAELLASRGHRVTLVSRTGTGAARPGITTLRADAMDPSAVAAAATGASVIYHCMNPKYEAVAWAAMLPRIQENLLAAAGRAGARLVVLDNVYALGRPSGQPLNEDTPAIPCSRKGEIRAKLADELLAAHRRGDARVIGGRASDFFGPRGTQTMFEQRFWTRVLSGKSAQIVFDADTPHTYHYIPDVAAGLAALGSTGEDALGRWWMLPCAPADTTRALIAKFAAAVGHEVRVERVPGWLFGILCLFVPLFREVREMQYQWDAAFIVDDRRFRERFGFSGTSLDDAARQTVAWARSVYGIAPSPA